MWIRASRPRTIRVRLIAVVVALVIPGWLGIAAVTFSFYQQGRQHIADGIIATARALVTALDRDLAGTTAAAQILAASPVLASDDFAAFHRAARDLLPLVLGSNFVVGDATGRQFANTLVPYGSPLPVRGSVDNPRKVFETGKPVVSNIFIAAVTQKPLIAIDVPVFRDGRVKYTLAIGVLPDRLTELLLLQKLPPDWVAAILDTTGVVVARTHESGRFVGKKGTADLLDAMTHAREGVVESATLDGRPSSAAFVSSQTSNWTVVIGVPLAALTGDLYRFLLLSGTGALLLLIIGLALAGHQARRIANAVQDLITPALALGRGEVPVIPRLPVREADDVAQALDRAYQFLQSRTVERDRAEREKVEAETVTRVMDDFVTTVSHELRTPLTSITGSLGLLAGGAAGVLPPRAHRLLEIAHANANRLLRLINEILDVGQFESGKMAINFAAVDLRNAVDQAIEANRAFADVHGARICFDAESRSGLVRADPDRLNQVITNLLSNAIKFSPQGGAVEVSIAWRADAGRVTVRDHGPGIPDAFKPHIFEKFAQADAADTPRKGGSGLGLSIVMKIVAQHGGTVGFEDATGGGTAFHVDIPLWHDAAGVAASGGEAARHVAA